jgi:adenosylmethionine-8-amino-7-oxononanoate aminotransferase
MFAAERYGIEPDLVIFAKGVTSGYAPLGGVLVSPRLWEPFYVDSPDTPVFRHGATYAGHATAAAVALRTSRQHHPGQPAVHHQRPGTNPICHRH